MHEEIRLSPIVFLFPNGGCGHLSYHFPFCWLVGANFSRSFLASVIPILVFSLTLALTGFGCLNLLKSRNLQRSAAQQR